MYDFFEDLTSTLTFLFSSTVPIALVSFFEMAWNCIHPVWPGVFNMVNVVGKYDFMA